MPSDPSTKELLRELHAPRVDPPPLRPSAEQAAVSAWAARYAQPGGAGAGAKETRGGGVGLLALLVSHRVALAFGALMVAIVGACVLPTSYDIPLGLSVEIRPADGERLPASEIARYVRERSDAAEVDVLVREQVQAGGGEPQTLMQIRLWDQGLALGEIEPELREQFPALADAEIVETALEGEIDTIWARRLAHRAFRVSLREADLEEARAQLLADLHSRGFKDEEVVVKVRDLEDGGREIEVEVEVEDRSLGEGDQAGPPAELELDGIGPGFD
ncbi:hypothetical protein ENSA5_25770 [Enhygromyxa salina]|uniref:Uncharacterized protein n=1 Tax=Enhygromyxa salina TaxID=215803 RepID=A0A2S9YAH7_9BACT|nr:hypothetical protein [Enhygromyxa salina]PRQ02118.1 hypothetical protein ENSA5_25770 [Enhygromyxa salina]